MFFLKQMYNYVNRFFIFWNTQQIPEDKTEQAFFFFLTNFQKSHKMDSRLSNYIYSD